MTAPHLESSPVSCWLSVVIPVFNEAENIESCLAPLQRWRSRGVELVLVDGGSTDKTVTLADSLVDKLVDSATPGRALQMQLGLEAAQGSLIWFLHGDTGCTDRHLAALYTLANTEERIWGRFDVRLCDPRWPFRWIETLMNWRSRLTGIATGDQGIFVSHSLLRAAGGIPQQALMEDVELSKRLLHFQRPLCLGPALLTSARRWQQKGIVPTICLMWQLRYQYWRGTPATQLHQRYYGHHPHVQAQRDPKGAGNEK